MHVAENMVGWQKRLGEYPTLSAIFVLAKSYTQDCLRSCFTLTLPHCGEVAMLFRGGSLVEVQALAVVPE
jgi:hypothetical protein